MRELLVRIKEYFENSATAMKMDGRVCCYVSARWRSRRRGVIAACKVIGAVLFVSKTRGRLTGGFGFFCCYWRWGVASRAGYAGESGGGAHRADWVVENTCGDRGIAELSIRTFRRS